METKLKFGIKSEQNTMNDTTLSSVTAFTTQQNVLQSWCNQLLKSKVFRGFYVEKRYVEAIKDYRDVVCLHKSEKGFEKILRDIQDKLERFYSYKNCQMWVGITSGPLTGIRNPPSTALETYLWVELKDLVFIEYWFNVKNIRFRNGEIIIKLEVVQPVEHENSSKWTFNSTNFNTTYDEKDNNLFNGAKTASVPVNQITLVDFILLLQQCWVSIKERMYNFIAEDINRENIKSVLRFVGLLIVTIFCVSVEGLQKLGYFTINLIYATNQLIRTLTPIILKIIDVFSKIIGGFFILLSMIWKDVVVHRNRPQYNAIRSNPNEYRRMHYNIRQR